MPRSSKKSKKQTSKLIANAYTRREFLQLGLLGSAAVALAAYGSQTATPTPADTPSETASVQLPPTPACGEAEPPTVRQGAGPFYTPDVPQRTNLREPGLAGTPLRLTGQVLGTDCQPIAEALLDFWHADDAGRYDNEGFTFRGQQYSDENGAYVLETIMPGLYPGRTRHIHVKVTPPGGQTLTTQLYFRDEPANASDRLLDTALFVAPEPSQGEGEAASFTFVLAL